MSKKKNNNDEQNDLNKAQTSSEGLDELYQEEPSIIKKPLVGSSGAIRAYYFFICLILGLLGGVLGEIFVNNYFSSQGIDITTVWQQPQSGSENSGQQVIILRSNEVNKSESDLQTLVEAAGASVVGIFKTKAAGETVWDNIYLPSEQIGNGLILSSDGWLVTTDKVITDTNADLSVILADKNVFPVTQKIVDKASGAVFLKIDAQGLKVVKFGSRDNWTPGEQLLVLANSVANGGIKTVVTNLEKLNYQPISQGLDLLQNTDVYSKRVLLGTEVKNEFAGSPVINAQGEIIGLVYGGATSNVVLPQDYFSQVVKGLLSSAQISRPYLGVNYLDLAHIVGLDKQISEGRSSGAVLYGEKGTTAAVLADSPAETAGLKAGDIITKVNNEPVDARHSLTELIQQYRIGDAVTLTIVFQGNEREVEVVLTGK